MNGPGTVLLSLGVYYVETASTSPTNLWTRETTTAFLPLPAALFAGTRTPADKVILCPDEKGPDEGELWPVKRRYWRFDGTPVLELFGMQVDPSPDCGNLLRTMNRLSWYTGIKGHPDTVLAAAGWRCDD